MIGNAHIDAPWLWPWPESMSVVLSTFRSALDRMDEDPDFTFTASSAQFYEWVVQADPKMMDEIRQRVKEGRWDVVGGWWVEPDVNIPNGESLVRQGLYAQEVFQRLFGHPAEIGYNPDAFGHPGTLPQILKLQGMHVFVFMRPLINEKMLPGPLFWWQSPDGSRVLAYRIPIAYGSGSDGVYSRLHEIIDNYPGPLRDLMAFYGAGDHGGGPTKININSIHDIQKQSGAPRLLFSTPSLYFKEVGKLPNLPTVADELQHVAVGCYTAEADIKKNNRAAEAALPTGEKMAVLGALLVGSNYPAADLAESWKKVLRMQFHDSLAGTALPEHYDVARAAYGYAMEVADQAINLAAQKIAWQIPTTDPNSEYLVVFNPHAWDAKLNVEYDLGFAFNNELQVPNSLLEDERGNSIPHQWTQASTITDHRVKLVFSAPVPAFGYRQFRLRKFDAAPQPASMVHASEKELENEHLRVTFADDGTLAIYDKDAKAEVFRGAGGGARAVVLNDPSDTWSHAVRDYTEEVGAFGNASFRVLENGPLRAAVRVRTHYGASSLQTDWILSAGARNLEARVLLDWHEHLKILKFSFPVDVQNPRPTYEIAYGYLVRKAVGEEDPGQRWVDLSGDRSGSAYGLAIINDAKYGYSVLGNDLRISIARGAIFAQHFPRTVDPHGEYLWQDQGEQTFRMLLMPHAGTWQNVEVVRRAEEFTAPVPVLYQGIHGGSRPLADSYLSVDAPDVVVSVVKKAEVGNDIIIRAYEMAGRPAHATLDIGMMKRRWSGNFRPLEIKTLRVPAGGGAIREVNVLEQ
jgi:alpha-mannosidase